MQGSRGDGGLGPGKPVGRARSPRNMRKDVDFTMWLVASPEGSGVFPLVVSYSGRARGQNVAIIHQEGLYVSFFLF